MKGVYCLKISVREDVDIAVGALGIIHFKSGFYAYIGSAQNNLEKRVARHLSSSKKIRWHIDYLLEHPSVIVSEVLCKEAGKSEECHIASLLANTADSIPRFGSSDCRCKSHLFYLSDYSILREHDFKALKTI